MAVKKSALYSKLWDSCNTLRSKGGMVQHNIKIMF